MTPTITDRTAAHTSTKRSGGAVLLGVCALLPARAANEPPCEILPLDGCRSRDRADRAVRSPRRLRTRRSTLPLRSALVTRVCGDAGASKALRLSWLYENHICHAEKRRSAAAAIRNNLRSWP